MPCCITTAADADQRRDSAWRMPCRPASSRAQGRAPAPDPPPESRREETPPRVLEIHPIQVTWPTLIKKCPSRRPSVTELPEYWGSSPPECEAGRACPTLLRRLSGSGGLQTPSDFCQGREVDVAYRQSGSGPGSRDCAILDTGAHSPSMSRFMRRSGRLAASCRPNERTLTTLAHSCLVSSGVQFPKAHPPGMQFKPSAAGNSPATWSRDTPASDRDVLS